MDGLTDLQRLAQLIRAEHPCVRIVTHEEDEARRLVREGALNAGLDALEWTIARGLADGLVAGAAPVPNTEHPAAALYHLLRLDGRRVALFVDLADHLADPKTLRLWRDAVERCRQTASCLVMVDHRDPLDLPPVVRSHATALELALPDEGELERIVRATVQRMHREKPIKIALTRAELATVVRNLRGLSRRQAEMVVMDAIAEDRSFDIYDLNSILARKRQLIGAGGLLEYVKAPVDLDAIGGLRKLKAWLKQRERAVTDEAHSFGIEPPRGVLMLGVQGSGKSLCAKAIATAWSRPLLRMDPGALYDRYVGESEGRLREALKQAESMAPVVLWIDEIEKGFASAASKSTDGGLSQRMFGLLLTWMQEHRAGVFMVATANDIEALPPELLRKGRFDEIFFVDLPCPEARRQIFEVHLRKRKRDPKGFDLDALAGAADGFSGAEIEAAIVSALHEAYSERRDLDTPMVLRALEASPPLSVTMAERVEGLREWAQGRCVPAD